MLLDLNSSKHEWSHLNITRHVGLSSTTPRRLSILLYSAQCARTEERPTFGVYANP